MQTHHFSYLSPLQLQLDHQSPEQFAKSSFEKRLDATHSILFSACRPRLIVDPILWLPMSSPFNLLAYGLVTCWSFKALYPHELLTRSHAIMCLHMHRRLQLSRTFTDPSKYIAHLENLHKIDRHMLLGWPIICQILHKLDYLDHDPEAPPLGSKLLDWFGSD